MTINWNLRNLIEPYLLLHLHSDDKQYIDEMFEEVYLTTNEKGQKVVTLKPHPNADTIALQFSILNGACVGMTGEWDNIKATGERINL